ncbi:MAG TPA: NAD(P)H-hydrate dehydratase [Holophagaceae bacterium]|nr:NAD(P)H-hydrate dehydratase [Holophagaceae bacterium]
MIPLLTADEMQTLEREAIASGRTTSLDLQERAAEGAASLLPEGALVEVVAGPGNNGGDALALARILKQQGGRVRVWTTEEDPAWTGDAALQAKRWKDAGGTLEFASDPAPIAAAWEHRWVVDGMFGLRVNRPLEGVAERWKDAMDGHAILALDQPSWIRPDDPDGDGPPVAITAAFGQLKLCHGLEPSRSRCGEIHRVDLGLDLEGSAVKPVHHLVDGPFLPRPSWNTHKRERGHVAIRAGSLGMSGAAVLATLGALRSGAGLVTVLTDKEVRAEIAAQVPEAMVKIWDGSVPPGVDVLLVGPGGVNQIPSWNGLMVVDASALIGSDGPRWMERPRTVITPHTGEFARLFDLPKQSTTQERLLQAASEATGPGVCLLKGPQTLTAGGGSPEVWINDTGHWGLASGGTGDFLAGMVAGLLGQGLSPREAAANAAWLHGTCADRLGPGPLTARDLAEELPWLLRELYA